MTWPQRPGGRDLPMGKKKKNPRRGEGRWTPATPHVQDGALVADAGNHEDEGIPLLRPGPLPSQSVMGTMESSIAADDPAATSMHGDKDVPLAWVNSGDSLSDSSLQLDISDVQGHVDHSRNSSNVPVLSRRAIRVTGFCRVWTWTLSRKHSRIFPRFRRS